MASICACHYYSSHLIWWHYKIFLISFLLHLLVYHFGPDCGLITFLPFIPIKIFGYILACSLCHHEIAAFFLWSDMYIIANDLCHIQLINGHPPIAVWHDLGFFVNILSLDSAFSSFLIFSFTKRNAHFCIHFHFKCYKDCASAHGTSYVVWVM